VEINQFSLCYLTRPWTDPVEFLAAAADAGFGMASMFIRSGTGRPLPFEIMGNAERLRAIRSLCARSGLRVFDAEAIVLDPAVDLDVIDPVLDTASQLGATYVTCVGNEIAREGDHSRNDGHIEKLAIIGERAARYGLQIGVEFMRYRDIPTLQEATKLIDASGQSNIGVIIDVLHLHRTQGLAAQVAALDPARIISVQLSDAPATSPAFENLADEARSGRLHLGDGVIPLREILAAIPEGVPIAIEVPVADDRELSARECALKAAASIRNQPDIFNVKRRSLSG